MRMDLRSTGFNCCDSLWIEIFYGLLKTLRFTNRVALQWSRCLNLVKAHVRLGNYAVIGVVSSGWVEGLGKIKSRRRDGNDYLTKTISKRGSPHSVAPLTITNCTFYWNVHGQINNPINNRKLINKKWLGFKDLGNHPLLLARTRTWSNQDP